MRLGSPALELCRAGLELGSPARELRGPGIQLLCAGEDLGNFVLDRGQRDESRERIVGGGLQLLQGLGERCRSGAGFRVIVRPTVALELRDARF